MCRLFSATMVLALFPNPIIAEQYLSSHSSDDLVSELEPDTVETIQPSQSDTSNHELFLHFASFTRPMVDCTPLASLGSCTISGTFQQSFDARISAYNIAFPGIQIDRAAIRDELAIENYLSEFIGLTVTPYQIEQCYLDFLKNTPVRPPPPLNGIRSILQCHVLLSLDTVTSLCEAVRKQAEEQDLRSLTESSKPWSYDEIRINTDAERCVVNSPYCHECLVTIDDFNHYLKLHSFRRAIRLDTARVMALRGLLLDHYYSELAKKTGVDKDIALLDKQEAWEANRRIAELNPFIAETIQDTALFRKMYAKYYSRFFGKKIVKTVQIIGSTDSSFIDSLYMNLSANPPDSQLPASSQRSRWAFDKNLRWVSCVQSRLSSHIISITDTLPLLRCARIKTPFGWFLCRIVSIKSKKERPLKEAKPQLVYLILEEQKRFKGVPDSLCVFQYYNNNKKKFVSPDTFLLQAWLAPRQASEFESQMDSVARIRRLFEDTVHFRSRILYSHQLPQKVRMAFLSDTLTEKNIGTVAGPFTNDYGTWYFRILKISPGGISLDFKEVQHQLMEEMLISQLPFDSIIETPTGEKIEANTALASLYRMLQRTSLEQAVGSLPDSAITKLCNDRTLMITTHSKDTLDRQMSGLARQMILDKKSQLEIDRAETWVRENRVDRQLLFLGCTSLLSED